MRTLVRAILFGEYVSDLETAAANFAHFETNVCFVGHTHVPVIFVLDAQQAVTAYAPVYGEPLSLAGTDRFIINPGSVGQPRDTDARAAYAVLDTDTVTLTHFRVAYDVAETQRRMIAHELPPPLIARLQYGFDWGRMAVVQLLSAESADNPFYPNTVIRAHLFFHTGTICLSRSIP